MKIKQIGISGILYAMFTYNTTPHTAINYTSLELLYGHQATLPMDLSLPLKPTYTYDNYAEELKQRLRATQQVVKSHINEVKIKAKIYADKDNNTKTFKIGDKVLLQDEMLRRERPEKLETPWTGPYRITEKLFDVNYKIQIKQKTICELYANRLKPFVEH